MKRFKELSSEQQSLAIENRTNTLLQLAAEGLHFEGVEAETKAAWKKAEEMQTPWFFNEYLMDLAGDFFTGHATDDAKEAFYPEPGDFIIRI